MARNSPEGSSINYPWNSKEGLSQVIRCPVCGNDGMDGSITGLSGQWGILRKCLKCKNEWSGGIGVQIADFTEDPPLPNIERREAPPKNPENTGAEFRNPAKNHDPEES
jgi:hypothetical protein